VRKGEKKEKKRGMKDIEIILVSIHLRNTVYQNEVKGRREKKKGTEKKGSSQSSTNSRPWYTNRRPEEKKKGGKASKTFRG